MKYKIAMEKYSNNISEVEFLKHISKPLKCNPWNIWEQI